MHVDYNNIYACYGVKIFKNKPLKTGSAFDIDLSFIDIHVHVTYINTCIIM